MEKRKIIQIATTTTSFTDTDDELSVLDSIVAICDDGSLWELKTTYWLNKKERSNWKRLPDIPQDDEQASK